MHVSTRVIIDRHIRSKMVATFKPVSLDWGRGRERAFRALDMEERVLDHADRDVGVSTRQVEEVLNVTHMTIWRVLHEHLLSPFHLERVQGLMPADFPARETLCWCLVHRSAEHIFVSSELFTDEARFASDGTIGIHRQH
jgi:hypothetical protein